MARFEFLFLYGPRFFGACFKKHEVVISNRATAVQPDFLTEKNHIDIFGGF